MTWLIVLSGILCIMFFFFYASYSIRSGIYVKAFCRKNTTEKVVALTFDDGPDPHYTPQVLDILKTHHVQATFFCIGQKVEMYPAIILRMQAEGHLIGNHSYEHSNRFPLFPLKKMVADLSRTQKSLEQITGTSHPLFRPPFGVTNPTIAKAIRQLDYTTIGWSIRSLDTQISSPEKVLRRITRQLSPGAVILLHDRLPESPVLLENLLNYLKRTIIISFELTNCYNKLYLCK